MPAKPFLTACLLAALWLPMRAAPLTNSAWTVIPSATQQIISVDYHELRGSAALRALRERVLDDNLKQFEAALGQAGINPDNGLDQITFVFYRSTQAGMRTIAIAQGTFRQKQFLQSMRFKKILPERYLQASMYPTGSGIRLVFLDPSTVLLGQGAAVKGAIDVRDNGAESLESNSSINDLISSMNGSPVWSVLDQMGTQTVMKSVLGQASSLADYATVKKQFVASGYEMNFRDGVTFDLQVRTSDSMVAASVASLVKAGMLYRMMSGTPTEKMVLDSTTVANSGDVFQLHFQTDDERFHTLLQSALFSAVSK
jgi:hypothetical protein